MQTPLENIEEGSTVTVTLNNQQTFSKASNVFEAVAAATILIDNRTLDSGSVTITMDPITIGGRVDTISMIDFDIYLSENPGEISLQDIRTGVANSSSLTVSNVARIKEVFAESYREGVPTKSYQVTLPLSAQPGELIENIGGLKHVSLRVPNYLNGGDIITLVVPDVPRSDAPEIYQENFSSSEPSVRFEFFLPKDAAPGGKHALFCALFRFIILLLLFFFFF